jgi:hypothetical protein
MIAAGVFAAFVSVSLSATIVILSIILTGAYSMKGPFWALASGWMSSSSAAAGLAAIGAIANLIGGAVMVNAYGMISEQTGSYTLAMLPLAVLCLAGGIAVLIMGRQARNAQLHEKQVTHSMTEAGHMSRFCVKDFLPPRRSFHQRTADEGLTGSHFLRQTAGRRLHQLPYFLLTTIFRQPLRWGRSGLTPQPACRERRRQASQTQRYGVACA